MSSAHRVVGPRATHSGAVPWMETPFENQPEWVIVVEPCYLESYGLCILMIEVLEAAPGKKKGNKKKSILRPLTSNK